MIVGGDVANQVVTDISFKVGVIVVRVADQVENDMLVEDGIACCSRSRLRKRRRRKQWMWRGMEKGNSLRSTHGQDRLASEPLVCWKAALQVGS